MFLQGERSRFVTITFIIWTINTPYPRQDSIAWGSTLSVSVRQLQLNVKRTLYLQATTARLQPALLTFIRKCSFYVIIWVSVIFFTKIEINDIETWIFELQSVSLLFCLITKEKIPQTVKLRKVTIRPVSNRYQDGGTILRSYEKYLLDIHISLEFKSQNHFF